MLRPRYKKNEIKVAAYVLLHDMQVYTIGEGCTLYYDSHVGEGGAKWTVGLNGHLSSFAI